MSDASPSRIRRSGFKSLFQFSVIGLAAAIAAACGGGGVGSEGTGITASFASGTVSGLGSVFVNGVEYDDSNARVFGDDGDDSDGKFTKLDTPLRVGMEVEVESDRKPVCTTDATTTPPTETCTASATQIVYHTELAGPVANLATDLSRFTVLGQTVNLTAATHYEDVAGAAGLAAGQIVKVHGRVDKTTGAITATFIEKKANVLADVLGTNFMFRLRGTLSALDTTARTGTIGGEAVTFAAGVDLTGLVVGQAVRVRIEPAATGPWQVNRIKSAQRKLDQHKGKGAELEGVITDFVLASGGSSATFKIDGLDVRVASTGVKFDDGASFAGLANDLLVEVEGTVDDAGVLVANKVELKSANGQAEIELKDTITAVDVVAKTFTLRGYTVDFSGDVVFVQKPGRSLSAADIVSGFTGILEVKGVVRQSDGVVIASRIKRDD